MKVIAVTKAVGELPSKPIKSLGMILTVAIAVVKIGLKKAFKLRFFTNKW